MNDFSRMSRQTLICALVSLIIAIVGGALGALYYIDGAYNGLRDSGYTLQIFRPLHTTYVTAWILMGSVAVVYHYLGQIGSPATRGDRSRYRFTMYCWMTAGVGILISIFMGISSGREYLGYHPIFSVFILTGWLSFAWTFFRRALKNFFSQPVYIYMWAAAIPYFVYTFCEGHLYLFDEVNTHPLVDLRLQWKHCGTLVGAFNHMVYGALFYFTEKFTGDKTIAQNWKSFSLFAVGLLNSLTNFAHHTYHLPGQSIVVKNISFVVSMIEVVLIFTILLDVVRTLKVKHAHGDFQVAKRFTNMSLFWNGFLMPVNILISIPFLNSYIHGTHLVLTHAMGSEIAIDTYILFATSCWLAVVLASDQHRPKVAAILNSKSLGRWITMLNLSLVTFIAFLFVSGALQGVHRFYKTPPPDFIHHAHMVFGAFALAMGVGLTVVLLTLVKQLKLPTEAAA